LLPCARANPSDAEGRKEPQAAVPTTPAARRFKKCRLDTGWPISRTYQILSGKSDFSLKLL